MQILQEAAKTKKQAKGGTNYGQMKMLSLKSCQLKSSSEQDEALTH